jgi:hypothetical protein
VSFDGQRCAVLNVLGQVGEVPHGVNKILDIALSLSFDFTGIKGFDLCDDRYAFFNFVGKSVQQHAPFVGGKLSPRLLAKGLVGKVHRSGDIVGLQIMNLCQLFT